MEESTINHGDVRSPPTITLVKFIAVVGQMVKTGDPIAQISRPDQKKVRCYC